MSSDLLRDILDLQTETTNHPMFREDMPMEFNMEPLEDLDFLKPVIQEGSIFSNLDSRLLHLDSSHAISIREEHSEDEYPDDSETLSKRNDPNNKKKRLRGEDLITSLKRNPMFKDHEELFQQNLDDLSRKKLMQKIRNRVSAQESRDRRKAQFGELADKTFGLQKENMQLKSELESSKQENKELRKENRNLREKIEELQDKLSRGESDSTNVAFSTHSEVR